ncbi:MAG: AmmeMemoRadiSam system radical SAM enzyme [Firmicutes bacterium]|nr:AmmeMemoRadiSam system radical SAM enzyme [Bacillota bacterium]
MQEALYYQATKDAVLCYLCPHFCRLKTGETGLCGVRQAKGKKLYTLNYGLCAALASDPIEKKPLYHFYPGQQILSVGTVGCNLDCGFCQNWQLARASAETMYTRKTPLQLMEMLTAIKPSVMGIAYTYSEPGMWYEFVRETAQLVHQHGLKNVLVTNGYLNLEPLRALLPFIDAFNIDVKAFTNDFYQDHCAGRLQPVLRYVEEAAAVSHVELTYLVVPSLNDNENEVRRFADWVADINPKIPVHFTRYYPQHRFRQPATPVSTLEKLREIALRKLQYVYLGNIPTQMTAHTMCPSCGEILVLRDGYKIINKVKDGLCPYCRQPAEIMNA